MRARMLDWTEIGINLRQSAMCAHDGELPHVDLAYTFLLDNPECFLGDDCDWPKDMPEEPNIQLIAAYYTNQAPGDES